MTSQNEHSTDAPAPAPPDAGLPALALLQDELPALARTAITLAKAGNTTALTLCFRLADPRRNLLTQLAARLDEADDETLSQIDALLARGPVV